MSEDRDDLLQHYRQMRADLLTAIDGLTDAQLTDPSLNGWSVKDHLVHLAFWDNIRASEIARISAGHDSAWRMVDDQSEILNAFVHPLRVGLSIEQARWELAAARQRVLDAIAAATPRGLDLSLYGEAALRSTHETTHIGWIKRWRGPHGL